MAIVTALTGTSFPEALTASFTLVTTALQQGTSILVTVTLSIL